MFMLYDHLKKIDVVLFCLFVVLCVCVFVVVVVCFFCCFFFFLGGGRGARARVRGSSSRHNDNMFTKATSNFNVKKKLLKAFSFFP